MKISISKTIKIEDYMDWFRAAPPKGEDKQWKEGRSALEMARFATSSDFTPLIKGILEECDINADQNFDCEPEAETYFPVETMGKSGPRNHDLLMIGDDCVIGIEAKVSESFDKLISEKRINATENMSKRLDGAIRYIYGDYPPSNVENLRYQLFSATIGTIEEAKKAKVKNAIILFLVFTGNVTGVKDGEIDRNNSDYNYFIESLKLNSKGGFKVADNDIQCYIKKIEIKINKDYSWQ